MLIPVEAHFHPPPPVKLQWPRGCIAQRACRTVTLLKRGWLCWLSSFPLESSLIVLSRSTLLPLPKYPFLASVTISVPTASRWSLLSLTRSFAHNVKPLTQQRCLHFAWAPPISRTCLHTTVLSHIKWHFQPSDSPGRSLGTLLDFSYSLPNLHPCF